MKSAILHSLITLKQPQRYAGNGISVRKLAKNLKLQWRFLQGSSGKQYNFKLTKPAGQVKKKKLKKIEFPPQKLNFNVENGLNKWSPRSY